MKDELLTPEEVSRYLKVNIVTVRRWLKSGKLKGTKLSPKVWRIRKDLPL